MLGPWRLRGVVFAGANSRGPPSTGAVSRERRPDRAEV